MSGSCREALPDVWEESGYAPECLVGLPGCPGVVGRTSLMSGSVGRTSQMSGSGREFIPDVREWSGDPPGSLRGNPSCPGVIGMPPWMSASGREAHPNVREWSGDPPGCLTVVWRPSRMTGRGREAFLDVW